MAVMFAEFLNHRGRVVRRERLDTFPVTLGRSRTSDVILDDPKVCPTHGELVEDPDRGLVLIDRDSVNGIRRAGFDAPVPHIAVRSGQTVRLGDTVIRFMAPDHAVEPTIPDRVSGLDRLAPMRGPAPAFITTGVVLGFVGILEAMSATWDSAASEALADVLGYGILAAMWAAVWTLVNRLVARRYRFPQHLLWGVFIGAVIRTAVLVQEYLAFMFPGREWVGGMLGLVMVVALVAAFYGHFSLVGTLRPVRRGLAAVGLVMAFGGLGYLASNLGEQELVASISFNHPIRPIPNGLVMTTTPDRFFAGVDRIKTEVDSLVK